MIMKRILIALIAVAFLTPQRVKAQAPFVPTEIPAAVKSRMSVHRPAGAIAWDELRYIPVLHYNAEGQELKGEMVVHRDIAADVADIFRQLHSQRYPIEHIQLSDTYACDDEQNMRANNTSAYCHRNIQGTTRLSKHAQGRAIDLNPLYNPTYRIRRNAQGDSIGYSHLQPSTAAPYVRRSDIFPYKLAPTDPAVRLFKQKGFRWGGDWRRKRDFQHFEK
jgi:hypothetical protein